MSTTNTVAPLSGSLRAQIQKSRGDALAKQEFESLDADIIGADIDVYDHAENVVIVLSDEEQRLQTNTDLSDAGRDKAMTRAVRSAHDKLRVIERKAADRRQAFNQESAEISAAPKPSSDPLTNSLRESDLRRQLQEASLPEQMRAYQTAVENSWGSTIRVFKDVEAFRPEEPLRMFIRRIDEERFALKEPKKAARLKTLQYSADALQALAHAIEFRLGTYGEVPTFKTPAIRTMDLGLANSQEPPKKSAHVDQPPAGVSKFQ